MAKFVVVVQKLIKEEHEIVLDTETAMQAFDQAQQLVVQRNATSVFGKYAIIKVKKEE